MGRKQSPIDVDPERLVYDHLLGPIELGWLPAGSSNLPAGERNQEDDEGDDDEEADEGDAGANDDDEQSVGKPKGELAKEKERDLQQAAVDVASQVSLEAIRTAAAAAAAAVLL